MKRLRSPGYPCTHLERATTLYERFELNSKGQPVDATDDSPLTFRYMGFDRPHGEAKRALAALVAYGLVVSVSENHRRRVKTSSLGEKFTRSEGLEAARLDVLREAALRPRIFAALFARFPDSIPPADSTVSQWLVEKGFSPAVTPQLIRDFRATASFAGLYTRHLAVTERRFTDGDLTRPPAGMRHLSIPLGPVTNVVIHYPEGLTCADLEFVQQQLEVYKGRLTVVKEARPAVRTGAAFWRNKFTDQPVVVTGYAGEYQGRHYVSVEESITGIPMDEIVYEA